MDPDSVILAVAPVALAVAMFAVCRLDRWLRTRKLERLYRLPSRPEQQRR